MNAAFAPSTRYTVNRKPVDSPSREERRVHTRRPFSGQVQILGMQNGETAALDLSVSGVGLLSSRLLSMGQVVDLSFLGRSVQVTGVVQRVRPVFSCDWHVGIQFMEPQPELAEVVNALH